MPRLLAGALVPLLTVASLLCAVPPARSQDEKASPLPSHFPLRKEACFGRVYDAKHLAQHPKQRVTSFYVARQFSPDPYTEIELTSAEELREQDGQDGRVNVSAYVRLRDRPGVFTNNLSCYRYEGKVTCGIDCDGGSFNLKEAGPALLLENQGFVVVGGCGGTEEEQDNSVNVLPGQDDKTFRLDPKPMQACTAERDTYVPAFAKLGKPLRERLATNDALCFARSYEPAHLAGHPQQNVRRIAVVKIAGKPKEDRPDYDLVFRAETKDGKKAEYKANCVPDMYAFVCTFAKGSDVHGEFYLARAGADQVMLRDRKGQLSKMFGLKLGRDDTTFRLQTTVASACAL
jgi:hypothetical protein